MSSIALYGPPGSGKTTLAASMTNLGYKVHFIDLDRKIKDMVHLQDRVKSGQITYHEITAPLTEDGFTQRIKRIGQPLLKQPKGYLEYADYIDMLGTTDPVADVLVTDSGTRVNEHLRRMIMYTQKRPSIFLDDYGIILNNFEELFMYFFALPGYKHTILICHDRTDQDEITGMTETRPLLDGQARDKLGSFVSEMYYCKSKIHQGEVKYSVLTAPDGRYFARTSRDIPPVCEADFGILFADEMPLKEVKKNAKR